jgi:hypothetical protein
MKRRLKSLLRAINLEEKDIYQNVLIVDFKDTVKLLS